MDESDEYRWGTYSTSEAANAGLDLEMPGATKVSIIGLSLCNFIHVSSANCTGSLQISLRHALNPSEAVNV